VKVTENNLSHVRNGKPLRFLFWGSLRPSADWDWAWDWDWATQGSPKRHPSVTQGACKGRFHEVPLFATKSKGGAGWGGIE
jgi:hypothetical protein